MGEPQVLGCVRCGKALTRPVRLLDELGSRYLTSPPEPTVLAGCVAIDPGALDCDSNGAPIGSVGCLVVNPSDAVGTAPHEDPDRHQGCCGADGFGGLNQRCLGCRTQLATLRDDCWTPQEVRFEPDLVRLMPQVDTW